MIPKKRNKKRIGAKKMQSAPGKSIPVLVVLCLIVLSASLAIAEIEPPVEVLPGNGVVFEQVDFLFSAANVLDSDWGRVTADSAILRNSTGLQGGYINIYTDAGWVVANLSVNVEGQMEVDGQDLITTYFSLGSFALPSDVSELSAYVEFSPTPRTAFGDGPRSIFPVGEVGWNAEGEQDSVTSVGPAPPPFIGGPVLLEWPPPLDPMNFQYLQPDSPNVQCAKNQCWPMAIANTLQYVENTFPVSIFHDHEIGLKGDDTLVGQLDTKVDRKNVISRTTGNGVSPEPMMNAKFEYLADNVLPGNSLAFWHQGDRLPLEDFEHAGIVSTYMGSPVTWEWICEEIQNGKGVVLNYRRDTGGGHCVRVYGCGITAGNPWIRYLHDRKQTNNDPTDSEGLEWVFAYVEDTDNDGYLNLDRVDNREIRHAMSHTIANGPPFNHWPVARINGIAPNPATEGDWVLFFGGGTDPDFDLIDSFHWESDIDGPLSDERWFWTRDLSVGTHAITFRVDDHEDLWSEEVSQTLIVDPKPEQLTVDFFRAEVNGKSLRKYFPVIFTKPGENLIGHLEVTVNNQQPGTYITPVIGTCSWGREISSNAEGWYESIEFWAPKGSSNQRFDFNLTAPLEPGVYHIGVFAGWMLAEAEVAANDSPPVFGNDNDIWDMPAAGWDEVIYYGGASSGPYHMRGRTVKVIVLPPIP